MAIQVLVELEQYGHWPTQRSCWLVCSNYDHAFIYVISIGDLATAIRNYTSDIHFGLYYSLFEWFHPLFLKDKANNFTTQEYVSVSFCLNNTPNDHVHVLYLQDVVLPQLYEIVDGYHPELIWSDGDWVAKDTYWNSTEFLAWLYNERYTVLIAKT